MAEVLGMVISEFGDIRDASDGKNRLTQVTLGNGTVINYAYDYQNRMVSRTKVSGSFSETKTFLYGDGTQVLEESYNGKRSALYGWGADGLDSRIDSNGQSLFYLKDGLGNTLALVDDRGNVVTSYEYSAYGENLSGADAVNAYRFESGVGGREDDDTGLVYFWNRWYDPSVGRWVTEDPIRQLGGLDLYEFCNNNSLRYTDPQGKELMLAAVGAGVGGSAAYVATLAAGGTPEQAKEAAYFGAGTGAVIGLFDLTGGSAVLANMLGATLGEAYAQASRGVGSGGAVNVMVAAASAGLLGQAGAAFASNAIGETAASTLGTAGPAITAAVQGMAVDAPGAFVSSMLGVGVTNFMKSNSGASGSSTSSSVQNRAQNNEGCQ